MDPKVKRLLQIRSMMSNISKRINKLIPLTVEFETIPYGNSNAVQESYHFITDSIRALNFINFDLLMTVYIINDFNNTSITVNKMIWKKPIVTEPSFVEIETISTRRYSCSKLDLTKAIFNHWRKWTDYQKRKRKAIVLIQRTWFRYTYSVMGPGFKRLTRKWYMRHHVN